MALRSVYQAQRPNQQNRERLVSDALVANAAPAAELRMYQARTTTLFPPRFGFDKHQLTIDEVISGQYPEPSVQAERRVWLSGGPADFSGSSRPSGTGWW